MVSLFFFTDSLLLYFYTYLQRTLTISLIIITKLRHKVYKIQTRIAVGRATRVDIIAQVVFYNVIAITSVYLSELRRQAFM